MHPARCLLYNVTVFCKGPIKSERHIFVNSQVEGRQVEKKNAQPPRMHWYSFISTSDSLRLMRHSWEESSL